MMDDSEGNSLCAEDKSPAYPKTEFFRSLFSDATRHLGETAALRGLKPVVCLSVCTG